MRSNDSFHHDKSAQYRESYQATAAKSPESKRVQHTQQYTPTKFSRKPSERLSELKNSINKCIQSISNKKQMNRDALQEVKDVNRQIAQTLSSQPSSRAYKSSQKTYDEYEQPQYRTDYAPRYDPRDQKQRQTITLSSFNLVPSGQNVGRGSNFQISEVYRPESLSSHQYQTQQMRSKIRSQKVQNQNLQRHLLQLQREQQQLLSRTSNFRQQQDPYLVAQNVRLRQQLQRQGPNESLNEIYEQFQKLKQDNERLRKQTISLLKNGRF